MAIVDYYSRYEADGPSWEYDIPDTSSLIDDDNITYVLTYCNGQLSWVLQQ